MLLAAPWSVDWRGWDLRAGLIFAAVGALYPAAVTLMSFESNRRIGPALTGALGNLTPVFAVLVAVLILGEAPRPDQLLALAVIAAGAALLYGARPDLEAGWAMALPVAAAFIRGLAQPVIKVGFESWHDQFAAALIGYAASALVVLTAASFGARDEPLSSARAGWFVAVGIANGAALLLMYLALAHGSVAVVAPIVAGHPVIAFALAALFLGDTRKWGRILAGLAATIAGVVLLLRA